MAILAKKITLLIKRNHTPEEFMKEKDLTTIMGVITDPIHNVYRLDSRKDVEEIQRMIRIFNITAEQKAELRRHRMLAIKNLATLKLVLSNN